MKNKKTMYYIVGAILLALALYFFWYKPKKKKENPNWNLLGSSKPTVSTTADGVLASQTAPIVKDTNVPDTDPTIGTAAATTRIAQLGGIRMLTPTYPVGVRVEPVTPCDGGYLHWDSFGGGTKVCRKGALS